MSIWKHPFVVSTQWAGLTCITGLVAHGNGYAMLVVASVGLVRLRHAAARHEAARRTA